MIERFWAKVDLKGHDRDISQFEVGKEFFPTMRPRRIIFCLRIPFFVDEILIARKTKHKTLKEQPVISLNAQPLHGSLPLVATEEQHLSSSRDTIGTALASLPSLEALTEKVKAVSRCTLSP